MKKPGIKDVAYCSERGRRPDNQDAIYISADNTRGIFVVADGMGGHSGGEYASGTIVNRMREFWISHAMTDVETSICDISERIKKVIKKVNDEIFNHFEVNGVMGGSTVAVLIIWDGQYATLCSGDSRIYCTNGERLFQLTTDDVWENLPEIKSRMTPEEIQKDERYGKLTQAVGSDYELQITETVANIETGVVFMLCSDGVYKFIAMDELQSIICKKGVFWGMEKAKRRIVDSIVKNNADDNYSMIVIKVS